MRSCLVSLFFLAIPLALLNGSTASADGPETETPIRNFIVLMQENHSFDNYFGTFPGVDGIPRDVCMPVDPATAKPCVQAFHIGDNDVQQADLDHSQATYRLQLNDGKLDGFVYALNQRNQDGRLAMGYYDERDIPFYWNLAGNYVLFDRFFSSAAAGSFLNHLFWVSGSAGNGQDSVPSDGVKDVRTIFDSLEDTAISWKFYVQNYDPALNYRTVHNYPRNRASQVTWAPILNISRFLDDPKLSSRIVDLSEYFEDLNEGRLPAVSYIVPSGPSEHPPSSLRSGQIFTRSLLTALMRSSAWQNSAFLITYDDWGGWYDHVRPPKVDAFGFGFRVPALLISPYAKAGYIDHTTLDFTSILKFIEENWRLPPVGERDATSESMMAAFNFSAEGSTAKILPLGPISTPARTQTPVAYYAYGIALFFGLTGAAWLAYVERQARNTTTR